MGRIFSVHEYDLRDGVTEAEFESALFSGEANGLLSIPGLTSHHFVRGVRGDRSGRYGAVWIYEDRVAWERMWGQAGQPTPPGRHPAGWRRWEKILSTLLDRPADAIHFTAYEELSRSRRT